MKHSLSSGTPIGAASPLPDKLMRYCAGVGALATAAALPAHSAQGAVSSYDAGGITGNTIYFDLQHTAPNPVSTADFAGADFELYAPTGTNAKPTVQALGTNSGGIAASSGFVENFANGGTVSSADTFGSPETFPAVEARGHYIIGLELPGGTATPSGHFYGIADLNINPATDTAGAFTLNGFSYNDTLDAPIIVPEPNSALLLIAGAAGVGVLAARRRKAAGATAA